MGIGTVVKVQLGMPAACTGVSSCESQLGSWPQLPATGHPGRQQAMVQVFVCLLPHMEIQMELPAPGSRLAQL